MQVLMAVLNWLLGGIKAMWLLVLAFFAAIWAADAAQWAEWLAYYVFICSMLVNALGGLERLLQTIEDWARDSFPEDQRFADKLKRWHRSVTAIADLINRLGAINFRDKIKPVVYNKRAGDKLLDEVAPSPDGPLQADDKSKGAGAK